MDIISTGKYPANKLSNFAGHRFRLDGVQCNSMEGFLQALKFENPDMQREVALKVGNAAKRKGRGKKWFRKQELYWQGKVYPRYSDRYKQLIARAYDAMLEQSDSFRRALAAAGDASFTHSLGKRRESETVLTTREFIGNLNRVRERMRNEKM